MSTKPRDFCLVISALAALLASCATHDSKIPMAPMTPTTPVPGNTTANMELQADVIKQLMLFERVLDKSDCQTRKIVHTEVLQLHAQNGKETREIWTLERCGKKLNYEVNFVPDPKGGTFLRLPFRPCTPKGEIEPNCKP